jgi:hypothetical protein
VDREAAKRAGGWHFLQVFLRPRPAATTIKRVEILRSEGLVPPELKQTFSKRDGRVLPPSGCCFIDDGNDFTFDLVRQCIRRAQPSRA